MLYNNYRNPIWKAVFQNCKIVSDAIWGRGNIIKQAGMYLLKTIKGDITKVTDPYEYKGMLIDLIIIIIRRIGLC